MWRARLSLFIDILGRKKLKQLEETWSSNSSSVEEEEEGKGAKGKLAKMNLTAAM